MYIISIQNGGTALHKASGAGQTAVVTLLLGHGADVHAVTEVHVVDCSATLGVFNPRRGCPARVTVVGFVCVCVWVCVSVKPHLTSGASVRPKNAVTYSAGKEGEKICGVFSETPLLPRFSTSRIIWLSLVGHFSLCGKTHMC